MVLTSKSDSGSDTQRSGQIRINLSHVVIFNVRRQPIGVCVFRLNLNKVATAGTELVPWKQQPKLKAT